MELASKYMKPDHYGEYLVQNLYYDDESWSVIRASIEKPAFKEKMRLRCYGIPDTGTVFFLELKKKLNGVVYKRRLAVSDIELSGKPIRDAISDGNSQVSRELGYYLKCNPVREKVYIAYQRTAFSGTEDNGLRVTFDTDMHFRMNRLDFIHPGSGCAILPDDMMMMEIKTLGGIPIWMVNMLSKLAIYPTSFSKFGTCYTEHIYISPDNNKVVA